MTYVVNEVSAQKFSLNGVELFKVYIPQKISDGLIKVVVVYDSSSVLIPITAVSNFTVDGATFTNATDLIAALNSVIYVRSGNDGAIDSQQIEANRVAIAALDSNKADANHLHDDRYYTQAQVDAKIQEITNSNGRVPVTGVVDGEKIKFRDSQGNQIFQIDAKTFLSQGTILSFENNKLQLKDAQGTVLSSAIIDGSFYDQFRFIVGPDNPANATITTDYSITFNEVADVYYFVVRDTVTTKFDNSRILINDTGSFQDLGVGQTDVPGVIYYEVYLDPSQYTAFDDGGLYKFDYWPASGGQNLQEITDREAVTTNEIETAGYIKTGRTDSDILLAGGGHLPLDKIATSLDVENKLDKGGSVANTAKELEDQIQIAAQGIKPFETLQAANDFYSANPPSQDVLFRVTGTTPQNDYTRLAATNTNSAPRPVETLPQYQLSDPAQASQATAKLVNSIGRFWRKDIVLTDTFKHYAFIDIKVLSGDASAFLKNGTEYKELFITFTRGVQSGQTSAEFQIGEKINGNVGVNINVFATLSVVGDVSTGIRTYTLNGVGNNLKLSITLDWAVLGTATKQPLENAPLNTEYLFKTKVDPLANATVQYQLLDSAVASQTTAKLAVSIGRFWKKTITLSDTFKHYGIIDLKVVSGDRSAFLKNDGNFRELFITFIRGVQSGNTSMEFQIGEKINGNVGVNLNVFATLSVVGDVSTGIRSYLVSGVNNSLKFSLTLDWSIFGTNTKQPVEAAPLNTEYFYNSLPEAPSESLPFVGKTIVFVGDSVIEFGNYPALIGAKTGATTINVGFGGARMGSDPNPDLDAFCGHAIAASIAADDFSVQDTANANLVAAGDNSNTPILDRLKAIDFSTVDILVIGYGTNDYTSSQIAIGTPTSTANNTLKGAMSNIIDDIMTAYPDMKPFFVAPTHRFVNPNAVDSDVHVNGNGDQLVDFANAIVEQADYLHIASYNTYTKSGFNKYNHNTYFVDTTHPNAAGYEYLAQRVGAFLVSQVRY